MNFKKIMIFSFLLLLITPFAFASDGDFTIPEVNEHITIQDDGACVIMENITYDITGSIGGIYRDIPIDNQQDITNIEVNTPGFYNDYEVIRDNGNVRIKVWLYSDEEKTQKITDEKATVSIEYTLIKFMRIYNDVGEFRYNTWGDKWDTGVGTLTTFIEIPGSSSEAKYWNNPEKYVTSSSWNGNELKTVAKGIPSNTSFEQVIMMPRDYFKSTSNAKVIETDGKLMIELGLENKLRKIFK